MDHYADDLYRHKNPAYSGKVKPIRFPFGWLMLTLILLGVSIRFAMGDAPAWTLLVSSISLIAFGITFVFRAVRWGVA